jgi:PKHD-type hydroxylase
MFYSFETDTTPIYTYSENFITPEECQEIIKIGLKLKPKFGGLIGNDNGDPKIRKSNTSWIHPVPEYKWIFDKIVPKIQYINNNSFKFNIYGLNEGLQFTHYKAPGGHYGKHIDKHYKYLIRRLSFTIQLNDPTKYKGGDLQLYDGESPKVMKRQIGSMTMFPSYVLHQVTPVTKGERFSLVGWITGANIR